MIEALQNLGRNITGDAVKAVLCVRSATEIENDTLEKAVDAANAINDKLMDLALKSLEGKSSTNTFKDIKSTVSGNGYTPIEVQYNPSSLRFTTSAGMQTDYDDAAGDVSVRTVKKPASTELSFELLFDDCNIMDAFMLGDNPVTNMSTGNLLQTGKNIYSMAKGEGYSVQEQMEALLALLTIQSARQVIFFWGSMSFRGEVTGISSVFTMFNKKGDPVRGKVGVTIRQGDSTLESEKSFKYDQTYWKNAFDRVFTDDVKKPSTLSALNNSMLNLKL